MRADNLTLSPVIGSAIAAAGMGSLFGTYWDDAWHTDVGRDSAWIPPHLTLYGAVAVAGLLIASWGVRVLIRTRSLVATLRQPALMLAAAGGVATLTAAPVDAAWHSAYGRDAVLWSPPHMLVVFASTAMVIGVLTGLRPTRTGLVEAAVAALVLGSLVMAVLEYETDVPQFSEVYYLPVLLASGLTAAALARSLGPRRAPVTTMVAIYIGVRLATAAALTALGRSTPDLPIAILGLALVDLPWRTTSLRYAAGAAGISALAWTAAATGLASQPPGSLAPIAVAAIAALVLLLFAAGRRRGPLPAGALAMLLGTATGVAMALTSTAQPAAAHDPGQGATTVSARLTGVSDGRRTLTLAVSTTDCANLTPVRLVARRAGQTITGTLRATTNCQYGGSLQVPSDGRWFTYAELRLLDQPVEAWLALDADRSNTITEARDLYKPVGTRPANPAQVGAGMLIYAAGLFLLAAAGWQAHRTARRRRTSA